MSKLCVEVEMCHELGKCKCIACQERPKDCKMCCLYGCSKHQRVIEGEQYV